MRHWTLAALTLTTLVMSACGGEAPSPQAPPAAPPATAAGTASAAPPPADTTPPPPPKPTLAELVPQTLKGVAEAFNAHDAKKISAYYTEDAVVVAYGEPAEAKGRDAIAKQMQTIFDFVGDAKSAPLRIWKKGDVAICEIVWTGTMTGDFMGIKATKKPLGQHRLHVVWFNDDGLIKEQHEYGDAAGVFAQMKGAKMAPPPPALPTNAPEVHAAKGTPDEDKLVEWAKANDEAFNKDDPKTLPPMAEDGDYWLNVTGGPATKGNKALTKELTAWFKTFPDQKWTVTNAWGIDGFAIVEHTMSGTQKGPLGPLAASNKPVQNWHFVDVMQPAADGKLQHGWGYANMFEMMAQTGALKPPSSEKAKTDKPADKTDKAAVPAAPKPAPAKDTTTPNKK
jgi:ketosteroid isomerase-like protein